MTASTDHTRAPRRRSRRRDLWLLLLFVGAVFLAMSSWGTQRRAEMLQTMRHVQATLDAEPPDDRVIAELEQEARAEFVLEVRRRAQKYDVQEMAMFIAGVAATVTGLIGLVRSARRDAPADDVEDRPSTSGPPAD